TAGSRAADDRPRARHARGWSRSRGLLLASTSRCFAAILASGSPRRSSNAARGHRRRVRRGSVNLLLDTCTFLWSVEGGAAVSAAAPPRSPIRQTTSIGLCRDLVEPQSFRLRLRRCPNALTARRRLLTTDKGSVDV